MHFVCTSLNNPSFIIKPWSVDSVRETVKKRRFKFLIKKLYEYFICVWAPKNILRLHKKLLHVVQCMHCFSFRFVIWYLFFRCVFLDPKMPRAYVANSFDVLQRMFCEHRTCIIPNISTSTFTWMNFLLSNFWRNFVSILSRAVNLLEE